MTYSSTIDSNVPGNSGPLSSAQMRANFAAAKNDVNALAALVGSGSGGITALTGDVTTTGSGSVAVTVTKINGQTPAAVATSNNYNDLSNKPTLGTAASRDAGVASGVATLGLDGKVPSAQLPTASSSAVTSVAGRTGAVTLTATDVGGLTPVATSGLFTDLSGPTSILLGPAISTTLAGSASGYALNADGTVSTLTSTNVGIHLRRAIELRGSAARARKLFAAVGRVRSRTGRGRTVVISDSTAVGGSTAGIRWPDQLANMLQANGLNANSNAKFGYFSTVVDSRETITGCTRDSTMISLGGPSLKMTQAGDKLTINPDTITGKATIWYIQNTGAGSFTLDYNGLGTITQSTAGTPGIGSVTITASPGFTPYNVTWASGQVNIIGWEAWDNNRSSFDILNASQGGSSTADWSNVTSPWSWLNTAVAIAADAYIIVAGVNDTAGSTPLTTYESRLQAMYTALSAAGTNGADVVFGTGLAQNPNDTTQNHFDSITKQETYVSSTLKVAYNNNCLAVDFFRGLGPYSERIIADPSIDSWVHGGTITYTCMAQILCSALIGDMGYGAGYPGSTLAYGSNYAKAYDSARYLYNGAPLITRGGFSTSLFVGSGAMHSTTNSPNNTVLGDGNMNGTNAVSSSVVTGKGSYTLAVFGSNNRIDGNAVSSAAGTGLTGGSNDWLVGMDSTVTTPTQTTSSYWNLWNVLKGSVTAATGLLTSLVSWSIPGIQLGSSVVTASATMVNNDYGIYADATSGAITYTLLTGAAYVGKVVTIQKTDASANTVTIAGTINGTANRVLTTQNAGYQLQYASVALGWRIIATY